MTEPTLPPEPPEPPELGAPGQPPWAPPATPSPTAPAGPPPGIGPAWLRALLALPYALVAQILAGLVIFVALAAAGLDLSAGVDGFTLLASVASYLFVVPAIWIGWRLFDQASLADMGHAGPMTRALRETGLGFLVGVLVLSAVVGLGAGLGAWSLAPGNSPQVLGLQAIWIPALLLAAYFEELLLRGWIQQDFGRKRPWLGLLLSSILFGLVHGANPNLLSEGPLGAFLALFNIFLAGLLLGSVFLLSGRLWLPTGLHLGWNWTVAVLFGMPVSGFDLPSFFEGRAAEGAGVLSGGAFGPEASVPALLVLLPVASWTAWRALKTGCQVPVVARHAPSGDAGDIIGGTSTHTADESGPAA